MPAQPQPYTEPISHSLSALPQPYVDPISASLVPGGNLVGASGAPPGRVPPPDAMTFVADGAGRVAVDPATYDAIMNGDVSWQVIDVDTGRALMRGEYEIAVPGYAIGPDGALEWRGTGIDPDEPYATLDRLRWGSPGVPDEGPYARLPPDSIYETVDGGLPPGPDAPLWRPPADAPPALPSGHPPPREPVRPDGFVDASALGYHHVDDLPDLFPSAAPLTPHTDEPLTVSVFRDLGIVFAESVTPR